MFQKTFLFQYGSQKLSRFQQIGIANGTDMSRFGPDYRLLGICRFLEIINIILFIKIAKISVLKNRSCITYIRKIS